jgi:hypothetical protein
MRSARCLVIAMASACGGSDGDGTSIDAPPPVDAAPPGMCDAAGTGSVNGTIAGVAVTPVVRAAQVTTPGLGVAIVLDEVAGACGQPAATGEHLVLGFCNTPTPMTYTAVGEQQFNCPGPNAFGLVEQNGGADFAESLSGTITISSATSACVTGTFDINFQPAGAGSPASLTGSFAAVICP